MEKITTKRQSNFELLRILCMLMIVAHHLAVHGSYPFTENAVINDYIIRFFTIGGKIGVNIFVLISGYFMVDSNFRIKKAVRLWAQMLFYSLLIFSLFLIFGKVQYSNGLLLNTIFPLSTNMWWFAGAYFIMYCLSPYINLVVKNCSKTMHLTLIAFLIVVQCFIQLIFKISHLSNVAWFITLYIIASYIKRYPHKIFDSNKIAIPVSIVAFLLIASLYVFLKVDFWNMTNIACLIWSVSVFCSFKNFNIKNSKIINSIAKTTFGVYLLHDHGLMRNFIWVELLKCPLHYQHKTFICFAIVAVLLVFVSCMIVDFIRELLFTAVSKTIGLITSKRKQKQDG
ncbi:MAG: acyltransferase [Clostridia bacterium]|nr:acyltransferase [Clostridia bacterium]